MDGLITALTRDSIRSALSSGVKTYAVYNLSHNLTHYYEAQVDASSGEACLLTRYKYVVDTSMVERTIETIVAWDDAWNFEA